MTIGEPLIVIPARLKSSRLKNKLLLPLHGKPMIYWAIKAAKDCGLINEIFVSSESKKILQLSKRFGAKSILRSKDLALDKVPKWDVILDALNKIKKKLKPDIVISIQPNSPNVTCYDITNCLYAMKKYKKNEIMSLDRNLMQNAAIRVVKYKYAFQKSLSTHCGGVVNDVIDVHYKKDLKGIS